MQKRLNCLKVIITRTYGVPSSHMSRKVNSIIRNSLEYRIPLFFDSPPTFLSILEVRYNVAIRLATDLPMWTHPPAVLNQKAGESTIKRRLYFLTKRFLLRLLAVSPGLQLGNSI